MFSDQELSRVLTSTDCSETINLNFNNSTGNAQEVRTLISSLLSCVSAPGLAGAKRSADVIITQVSIFKMPV